MVYLLEDSGFCGGVRNAYARTVELTPKIDAGKSVYLYGHLANNQRVMDTLTAKGFVVVESVDDIADGSVVVIRSHGVPEAVFAQLAKKNVEIVDCTCSVVKKIHKVVKEKTEAGETVIIIGSKGHPEVIGIHGWCNPGFGFVAGSAEDLKIELGSKKITVVGQTTCDRGWWDEAVSIIKAKFPCAEIRDTLCNVVSGRVDKAVEIAKKCDVMVVVGDKSSANSMKLVESCKGVCKDVRFITCVEDIADNDNAFAIKAHIGLVGSASTPDDLLEQIHSHLTFLDFLSEVKRDISTAVDEQFECLIIDAKGKPFIEEAIMDLYTQNKHGKAIRAAMIKLGEIIAGGDDSHYLPIALSYELFQTAILIHDDIIDKSPMRRGKKTIHSAPGDSHLALSRAICIGDMGFFLVDKILAESNIPPARLIKILQLFSKIKLTTLEGEIMDVCLPHDPIDIKHEYEKYTGIVENIYEYKTAWYTLVGPMMLGGICGSASSETLETLKQIALPLGLAFQIKDDILGIFSTGEALGKSILSDISEKKQTLLYGYAAKHANKADYDLLCKSYGKPSANENDLHTVREIFIKTGALSYAESEIERQSKTSLEAISRLDDKHQPLLRGLVSFLINRRY